MNRPDIHLKRAYEPASGDDGMRLLVDRVWPRGVSRQKIAVQGWLKEIAPSTALRTWFGHDPARWDEFRRRYAHELDANPDAVDELRGWLKRGRVTLVYGARDTEHNQAVALREYVLQAPSVSRGEIAGL
ncbi:uncharacterized protein YeaO (DUF488 family) [Luteimonas cucumeris]|uniref:Uncharacterized protein YeaO (DUF488 family) n=1 Tax=Luteimonas cucumeris TaxID=985012 RepID=A0A562LA64_9GAMM|nr:DUF488 domain-containing protein [Luteimonas cucumeris]TWI04543.1 uncharacterized protein YeaO (DUF488 family) [Luteimonas cucumeris]